MVSLNNSYYGDFFNFLVLELGVSSGGGLVGKIKKMQLDVGSEAPFRFACMKYIDN